MIWLSPCFIPRTLQPHLFQTSNLCTSAQIPSGNGSPVHAKSYLKPLSNVCWRLYKQSWAHFLAFLPLFPEGCRVHPQSPGLMLLSHHSHLDLSSHHSTFSPTLPPSPHRLLIQRLSCCIFPPSVHKKSNKAKAAQYCEEPGRNTLQALKLDPGAMPNYLAFRLSKQTSE